MRAEWLCNLQSPEPGSATLALLFGGLDEDIRWLDNPAEKSYN
jgi:hypothetical protein